MGQRHIRCPGHCRPGDRMASGPAAPVRLSPGPQPGPCPAPPAAA